MTDVAKLRKIVQKEKSSAPLRKIKFHRARRPDPFQLTTKESSSKGVSSSSTASAAHDPKAPHEPKRREPETTQLYPVERACALMHWKEDRSPGAGLINCGNTCFMNSVLQCLTHTAPLANYALTDQHSRANCSSSCAQCILVHHICTSFSASKKSLRPVIKPVPMVKSLRMINRSFRLGYQEDAHEYLRCLLDKLQSSFLKNLPKLPFSVQETTFLHRTFGLQLCSQILCTNCRRISAHNESALDLSLELSKGVVSVDAALAKFTRKETLDKDNMYKCEGCKNKVRAEKRLTIAHAPNILTIHLKRFQWGSYGGKVSRPVQFKPELSLAPYMTEKSTDAPVYRLYAVLVHSGHSCNSGHYYSFVRSPKGDWFCCNDESVSRVRESTVLEQQAYLLFYSRTNPIQISDSAPAVLVQSTKRPKMKATVTSSSSGGGVKGSALASVVFGEGIVCAAEPDTSDEEEAAEVGQKEESPVLSRKEKKRRRKELKKEQKRRERMEKEQQLKGSAVEKTIQQSGRERLETKLIEKKLTEKKLIEKKVSEMKVGEIGSGMEVSEKKKKKKKKKRAREDEEKEKEEEEREEKRMRMTEPKDEGEENETDEKNTETKTKKKKNVLMWKGKKGIESTVSLLRKDRSFVGFGSTVQSWDSGVNSNDSQKLVHTNPRNWHDKMDREIDKGRVKKVKEKKTKGEMRMREMMQKAYERLHRKKGM